MVVSEDTLGVKTAVEDFGSFFHCIGPNVVPSHKIIPFRLLEGA